MMKWYYFLLVQFYHPFLKITHYRLLHVLEPLLENRLDVKSNKLYPHIPHHTFVHPFVKYFVEVDVVLWLSLLKTYQTSTLSLIKELAVLQRCLGSFSYLLLCAVCQSLHDDIKHPEHHGLMQPNRLFGQVLKFIEKLGYSDMVVDANQEPKIVVIFQGEFFFLPVVNRMFDVVLDDSGEKHFIYVKRKLTIFQ